MKNIKLFGKCAALAAKITFCLYLAILAVGCRWSDPDGATKALKGAGYTDIKIESRYYGCSDGDTYVTGFKAKGPTGIQVSGVVCSSYYKGNTIRTD